MSLSNPEQDVLRTFGEVALEVRRKCQQSVLYLGTEILGYDYKNPADFMVHTARAIEQKEDFLLLAPRGHGKTVLVDVVGTIFDILRDPDIRILLSHGTRENAKRIFFQVMQHFRVNPALRRLFPEFVPHNADEEGTTERFMVPCRRKIASEPTLMIAAPGATVTGMHYDIIRASDLVNEQNVPPWADPEQMVKVKEFFSTFIPLLDQTNPEARRSVDGTRWHDGDLYGDILRANAGGDLGWTTIVEKIDTDENGELIPIWEMMPIKTLKAIRADPTMSEYLWAANYINDPLPAEGASTFRKEWFKTYVEEPDDLDIAITVDLAISEKTTADRSAIVVSGICPDGNLYVLHAVAGRWTPGETIDRIFDADSVYSPKYIGVESVAWQKAMVFMLHDEAKRRGHPLPLRALLPDGNKIRRAAVISNHAQRYNIHVKNEHHELVDEFLRFPVGQHDDFVDALAYRGQDLFTPHKNIVPITKARPTVNSDAWRPTGASGISRLMRRRNPFTSLRRGG